MEQIIVKAERRDESKSGSHYRKEGFIPAVIYNHGKTEHIKINTKEMKKKLAAGVSESVLYDIEIDGKSDKAFIKDYQTHPLSGEILHLDFFRITFGEKVKTHIPVHLTGKSIGEKEGGILEIFMHDIELELLPKDLVPSINIDISHLKLGEGIHLKDVKLPESAHLLTDENPVLCHISVPAKPKAAEEDASTATTPAEGVKPAEQNKK